MLDFNLCLSLLCLIFFKLGFTPYTVDQPILRYGATRTWMKIMTKSIYESCLKRTQREKVPINSKLKTILESSCGRKETADIDSFIQVSISYKFSSAFQYFPLLRSHCWAYWNDRRHAYIMRWKLKS